ncbi:hypothetical protein Trco_008000 [Trichoderma cornu-damae]|uniref:Uncharacterized protein n=1 Tax=Trichoderma cornu-damae TaxID=654480 RepID=A0A9P8QI18_9HYPO|nr:hypothetical protein Trco_008000 [Trichoderma cornu-damae]
MPPPRPPTSTSTENLILKCQKEARLLLSSLFKNAISVRSSFVLTPLPQTHKKCLPPEWSVHPPNQEVHPPRDTLALAIQVDSSSPGSVSFYETASGRSVGSVGPEYRGSVVVVPWRPGLKFICSPSCRRRSGCRVGVVREAKPKGAIKTKTPLGSAAASSASRSGVGGGDTGSPAVGNTPGTKPVPPTPRGSAARPTTLDAGDRNHDSKSTMGSKRHGDHKHVSFDDGSIGGKSSIETDNGGSRPYQEPRVTPQQRQRCKE